MYVEKLFWFLNYATWYTWTVDLETNWEQGFFKSFWKDYRWCYHVVINYCGTIRKVQGLLCQPKFSYIYSCHGINHKQGNKSCKWRVVACTRVGSWVVNSRRGSNVNKTSFGRNRNAGSSLYKGPLKLYSVCWILNQTHSEFFLNSLSLSHSFSWFYLPNSREFSRIHCQIC